MTKQTGSEAPKHSPPSLSVPQMFDRISPRYDLLNHCLSLALDCVWRRRLARNLEHLSDAVVLDMACGTGDQALAVAARTPDSVEIIGADMAIRMLERAKIKGDQSSHSKRLTWLKGDAMHVPLCDASVDTVTISFGIRNVPDPLTALTECYRVLRPNGQLLILEFGMPDNFLLRPVYQAYFRFILPTVGGLISGDFKAYRYLNTTVEAFPYGDAFLQLLAKSGFAGAEYERLSCGITYLYKATKRT